MPKKRSQASSAEKRSPPNWYDHPQYFDMVFRDEIDAEVRFFEDVFQRRIEFPVQRIYEPGCGSGRLVAAMAARNYDVVALDNNKSMLAYLRQRLRRRGLAATLIQGDMTEHICEPPVDAAFCTFNTFRHMLDEKAAVGHLRAIASSLRKGGIYVLGFHCIPMDADPDCTERLTATHGGTRVSVTLRVVDFRRRERRERLRVSIKATKPSGKVERIQSEFDLRLYTPRQAHTLVQQVSDVFELVGIHDFDYDLDIPRRVDNDLTEAVFLLRRR